MNDYITAKERLTFPKYYQNKLVVIALIIIVGALACLTYL